MKIILRKYYLFRIKRLMRYLKRVEVYNQVIPPDKYPSQLYLKYGRKEIKLVKDKLALYNYKVKLVS